MANNFKLRVQVPTETEDHYALVEWAQLSPICRQFLIHIPNEGKREPWYGKHLKRMGLKRGVSDFFLAYPSSPIGEPGKSYHGLFLELKRQIGGKVTPEQQEWIDKMRALDYKAEVAYGFNDARNIISAYLSFLVNAIPSSFVR